MSSIASQLPFEIFPTDDEQAEITEFSIPCPECKRQLGPDLHGTVEHDTIKKAVFNIDCFCSYCGVKIKQIFRMEVEEEKFVSYQKVGNKWNRITLA